MITKVYKNSIINDKIRCVGGDAMKSLEAKNLIFTVYIMFIMFVPLIIYAYIVDSTLEMFWAFLILFGVILIINIWGYMRIRKRHWIKYGDRKIIICRETKEIENGHAVGFFKTKIIEISVDDISSYGRAWKIPRKYIDTFRSGYIMGVPYAFVLNDERMIFFEGVHYSDKQLDELFDYIYNETGKKVIKKKIGEK